MDDRLIGDEMRLDEALAQVAFEQAHRAYWEQHEFLFLERVLPRALVEACIADAERMRPRVHRNYIPGHKQGGSVSFYDLSAAAPAILALYRSPALRRFLSRLVEADLHLCPDDDPHACALYFYTEPGDHIGWHYDTSYYEGARYTVLVGLVERSQACRLVAELARGNPDRPQGLVRIAMDPGSMVIFNGDKLWHAVTPLALREERIVLTLQYVVNQRMRPSKRLLSNLKDCFAYFGPAALWRRGPDRNRPRERTGQGSACDGQPWASLAGWSRLRRTRTAEC